MSLALLALLLALSVRVAEKTQHFVHSRFNPILQLINRDVQKSLKYFNGTAVVTFLQIPFGPSASAFPTNLAISALKLVVSYLL